MTQFDDQTSRVLPPSSQPGTSKTGSEDSIAQRFHDAFFTKDPRRAARALESCTVEEIVEILAHSRASTAGKLLLHISPDLTSKLLAALPHELIIEALLALPPVDAAMLLRFVDSQTRHEILELAPQPVANTLLEFLDVPPNSAALYLESGAMACYDDQTVQDAIEQLERVPSHLGHAVVVLSRDHRVMGMIPVRDLIGKEPHTPLAALSIHAVPLIRAMESQDALAQAFESTMFTTLPVVDHQERFMGVIPHHRILVPWKQSLLRPWLHMLGLSDAERQEQSLFSAVNDRIVWSILNAAGALVASGMLAFMPSTATEALVSIPLVLLVPLALGLQSFGMTLYALGQHAPNMSLLRARCFRELQVTAVHGGMLAIGLLLAGSLWFQSFRTAWIISVAVWLASVIGCITGVVAPWISRRQTTIPLPIASASFVVFNIATSMLIYLTFWTYFTS